MEQFWKAYNFWAIFLVWLVFHVIEEFFASLGVLQNKFSVSFRFYEGFVTTKEPTGLIKESKNVYLPCKIDLNSFKCPW